jgi:hypothetical protein
LLREGEALRKIGQSAELFEDHSPLQLGASGRFQGEAFTLVGRLQYRYGQGTWNEWHALFDNARSGWLSEDNSGFVFSFDQRVSDPVPAATSWVVGHRAVLLGRDWSVATVTAARLIAAQGELPQPPQLERGFVVADLRSAAGEVMTLDYSSAAPHCSVGRAVALADLALIGLLDGSGGAGFGGGEKNLKARAVECPSCGAALELTLATTQSIVCKQCHAVVDVSQGVGGDLTHYAQENGMEPQIALGKVGTLKLGSQALPWQVVGYAERCEVVGSGQEDEQSFWREYLLYHRTAGFAFLVDAEDGWSWSIPITGAPKVSGDKATYQTVAYRKMYQYQGAITYVLGEFYWQLQRGQTTANADYRSGNKRLNSEFTQNQGEGEMVWSAGDTLSAAEVSKAFRLAPDQMAALERDVTPLSAVVVKVVVWIFLILLVLLLVYCTTSEDHQPDCNAVAQTYGPASQEYNSCLRSNRSSGSGRTGGGSFGGFSTGGGHK